MCVYVCVPGASPSIDEQQPCQETGSYMNPTDEVLLNVIRPDYERPAAPPPVEPLYKLTDDGKVQGKHLV